MARRYYSSVAVATALAADVNNVATTIQVSGLTGFPAQAPFTIIVDQDQATEEVMEVTNVASLVLTVARGIDGTNAVAHTTGAIVRHGVSARDFDEANEHNNDDMNDVHAQYVLKSTATTAGDLLVRDSSSVTRLPVGTSGQVLTVDESVAAKVKWAAAAAVDTIPVGVVMPYAGASAPSGWLLCQGQEVSQVTYAALYALVGAAFGSASAGQFKVPDLRGRTVFGLAVPDASFDTRGETGGAKSVTLSSSNMPSHNHGFNVNTQSGSDGAHAHNHNLGGSNFIVTYDDFNTYSSIQNSTWGGFQTYATTMATSGSHSHTVAFSGTTGSAGSGSAFSILNPYLVLNYIIKAS